MKYIRVFLLFVFSTSLWATDPPFTQKEIKANRTDKDINIDGTLDEEAWEEAELATDFIQRSPNPGHNPSFQTIVKVLYDDEAIYIGAILKDPRPDSIFMELSERDRFANTDWFGMIIDTYRSGINGYSFAVTPAGVQSDARLQEDGRDDEEWDAVWESSTQLISDGWIAEFRIPYRALRFPKLEEQNWHINFGREIRRFREESFWNPIDPQIDQFLAQSGILSGIENIKPPLRLSAFPFVAMYAENYKDPGATPRSTWGRTISGGLDMKLGISEAFTLDMTLIPDFGQVRSDNVVLNLSPFEVRFDENRQFFTEGTEIFNKADLFYSRRIGGRPIRYGSVNDKLLEGESIVHNPRETQLINASKISGRTNKGLGIGVFNAISSHSDAIIEMENGDERAVRTNPLTNYNIIVFDQQLRNNSFVSLINTNVMRAGDFYDADVSGGAFRIQDRKLMYAISGQGAISQKYYAESPTDLGESLELEIEKFSGNFQWRLDYDYKSADYDINDLGLIRNPNIRNFGGRVSYNKFTPFWHFNRMNVRLSTNYIRLVDPNVFSDFNLMLRSFVRTKSFWGTGIWMRYEPVNTFDYFEPRTSDFSRYYQYPRNYMLGSFISSNYNKRFAFDLNGSARWFDEEGRKTVNMEIEPRFRFNNRWNMRISTELTNQWNDVGYVNKTDESIIFGIRDRKTIVNLIQQNFTFNKNATVSFRLRHYWSNVKYDSFRELGVEGELLTSDYEGGHNDNFNAFNIDMVYRWRFAPGSDVFIVWKNAVYSSDDATDISYFKNMDGLFENPVSNSFSLKCVYFLDYLNLKKKLS